MHSSPCAESCEKNSFLTGNPTLYLVAVLMLFVTAFSIRLHNVTSPPLDFAPIRQYQNLHIIRGLYYENNVSVSESRKEIAKTNMDRMGFVLEPRIIENASLLGYRALGSEQLWVPRVVSSVFWIVGGIFLFNIARRFFSQGTVLFSLFFYLFLPYAILSSRVIQPDPLMVMMMLWSIDLVLKYDEKPTVVTFLFAAAVASAAVLIKPYCVFIIFGGFFALQVFSRGFWKAVFNRNTFIYGLLIILPTIFYYFLGFFLKGGFLGEHAKGSFLPHLLVYPPFWSGWLSMIGQVVGYLGFLLALIGLVNIKSGKGRSLMIGLWTGYFVFGLSATYQIHTHSYYTMPFIPIVALSLGPVFCFILGRFTRMAPGAGRRYVIIFIVIILIAGAGLSVAGASLKKGISDYKKELRTVAIFLGLNPDIGKFLVDDFKEELEIAKEIGNHVQHSTNTIFLTPHFGRVLAYHGEFAGMPWPTSRSIYGRSLRGTKQPDIKDDFTSSHVKVLYQGRFIEITPDYFIITALDEYEKQQDLKEHLKSNYPLLVKNDKYLIFDLRSMSSQ